MANRGWVVLLYCFDNRGSLIEMIDKNLNPATTVPSVVKDTKHQRPSGTLAQDQSLLNIQAMLAQFKELTQSSDVTQAELATALNTTTQIIGGLLKKNEELTTNEKHSLQLKQRLPIPIFSWDLNDKVTDFNDAATRVFGFEISEIVGKSHLDLLVPPELKEEVTHKLKTVKLYPEGLFNRGQNVTKDGRRIICDWVNFPLYDQQGRSIGTVAVAQDITRNQLVEEQFQRAEARWQHYWESIPDGIVEVDLNGNILLANRAFYQQSKHASAGSNNLLDYMPEEHRATLKQVINKAKSTALPQAYELPVINKSHATWWSKLIIPVVKDNEISSLLIVSSDVTERKMAYQKIEQQVQERTQVLLKINQELKDEIYTRKQIEASLRESESRYYRLTSICPVGIFRGDSKGRTIYMNERCAEIVGLPLHEALGYGWSKTIHPDDFDRVMKETYHAWEHQISYKSKLRHLHRDGAVVWVIAEFLNEIDDHDNFKGFVGTLTDITRLMQAEEKIHQHEVELEHRARINMVGEMISGIAHEVNQPLAMIVNYTAGCLEYLQREDGISPKILDMMQRVFDQAERAGKIIHRLKEFLRKGTLEKELLNINSVINDVVSLVAGVLKQAKINLKLDLKETLPEVFADKIQIEQVILNLIQNANDALKEADWMFRKIIIQTRLSANSPAQLEIRVADTGPGIEPDIADKIFDAFFTTKEKGMGVGLSISATILEVHGGRISLDRDYKEGTAFIITLPIQEV